MAWPRQHRGQIERILLEGPCPADSRRVRGRTRTSHRRTRVSAQHSQLPL